MDSRFTWDEDKRQSNLNKHQLDFDDAGAVLDSPLRLDVQSPRRDEARTQSFAYVFDLLAVLTVVHVPRQRPHIISFRPASRVEREIYHEWLEKDFDADA